jgi:hypothetical protein
LLQTVLLLTFSILHFFKLGYSYFSQISTYLISTTSTSLAILFHTIFCGQIGQTKLLHTNKADNPPKSVKQVVNCLVLAEVTSSTNEKVVEINEGPVQGWKDSQSDQIDNLIEDYLLY